MDISLKEIQSLAEVLQRSPMLMGERIVMESLVNRLMAEARKQEAQRANEVTTTRPSIPNPGQAIETTHPI